MLARAIGATPWGIEARPVEVEVDVRNGMPQMQIVGLPDAAVRESRERVRTAIRNCGFELPHRAVTVNLAPADIRKAGNHLDLAIALGLLAAYGLVVADSLPHLLLAGELGLDGTVRPIRGGLAMAELASRLDCRELILPRESCREAAAHPSIRVIPVDSLAQAIEHLVGVRTLEPVRTPAAVATSIAEGQPDLAEVRGQSSAKRALEIAAAGGHNVLR